MNEHTGSSFDDFLGEEGILDEAELIAKARIHGLTCPEIKFCPACGHEIIHKERWYKNGMVHAECGSCHTHFGASGYREFVIPDTEEENE